MVAPIRWVSILLLLCSASASAARSVDDPTASMDALVAAKMEETQRAYAVVAQLLRDASQVEELFVMEDEQLQLLALEMRTKLAQVQEEVRREMQRALEEVEARRRTALGNVTAWRETVDGLRAATRAKRRALKEKKLKKEIEEVKEMEKKAQRELELLQELERQREEEKELARKVKQEMQKVKQEMQKVKGVERLREKEKNKQQKMEQQQILEEQQKSSMEKQRQLEEQQKDEQLQKLKEAQEREQQQELKRQQEKRQQVEKETSRSESPEIGNAGDGTVQSGGKGESQGVVKRLLDVYVPWERVVLDAGAAIYRQLVLPVVAILGFFVVLTVVIARYHSMKQARRNRRVLYSGYPKTYRSKTKQEAKAVPTDNGDLRPRYRHPAPRRDPNDFIGN